MKIILTLIVALSTSLFANTYYYECQDDYNFTARYEDEKMWLFLPHETVALKQVRSASGARYTKGKMILFTKAQDATLCLDGRGKLTCKNNPKKALHEKAKLDGYNFQGLGNEPGWELLLQSPKSRFTYDYGEQVLEFTLPKPRSSGDSTLYHYRDKHKTMMIEIHNHRCFDSMSGEEFEVIVSIKLNGRLFTGCGNALH